MGHWYTTMMDEVKELMTRGTRESLSRIVDILRAHGEECKKFLDELQEAKKKIIAERVLRPDAYAPRTWI